MTSCKELARQVKDNIKEHASGMAVRPSLAIITVGADHASAAYIKGKIKDYVTLGDKLQSVVSAIGEAFKGGM